MKIGQMSVENIKVVPTCPIAAARCLWEQSGEGCGALLYRGCP